MESLFEQVEHGRIWPLEGGVHPPACKENTSGLPITEMPLPDTLILPLKQHIGEVGKLIVNEGDKVLKGQPLSEPVKGMSLPVHAPTSGTVTKIAGHPVAHPSGLSEPCLFLKPDGEEKWVERKPMQHFTGETPEYLVNKIKMAGISGLGGAGFPAYVKSASLRNINYLIINATECEPYITADESLIQRSAEQIIQGIDVVANIVNPNMILIGIEDDKPQAIKALREAADHREDIHIRVFPAKYPSGGEKQLIKILTGEEVPSGGFPIDVGILVHNIGTLYAIYKAVICDEPLISRVVTVTGDAVDNPQNIEVLLGTPVDDLLEHCGFKPGKKQRVIMGGPMMGFTLSHTKIPVVKISNCILAPGKGELPEPEDEMDCIRCGACADACPVKLLPQQMFWYAKAKDLAKSQEYNIKDCIECGACAYVCPSQIPLVQYYRVAKAEIRAEEFEKRQAEKAKQRFEARKERLEREAQERAEKQRLAAEKRKKAMAKSGGSSAVADALARVKAKKAQQAQQPAGDEGEKPLTPAQAAVARAKAKQQQKAKEANQDTHNSLNPENEDTQNVAVDESAQDKPLTGAAAAVAKAKARKRQQALEQEQAAQVQSVDEQLSEPAKPEEDEPPADPKKAAIAAAVAKAKARKAQKQQDNQQAGETSTSAPPTAEIKDDKKAAIAAAVAKAKARKQQKEQAANVDEPASDSDRQKTAQEDTTEATADASSQGPKAEDDKKARIAAAIAKAKAKKQAQAAQRSDSDDDNKPEPV